MPDIIEAILDDLEPDRPSLGGYARRGIWQMWEEQRRR